MASPDDGRGASQWTHSPLSQASAQTTATTPTPHWPLRHTDQNQKGWLTRPTMQAQRWNCTVRLCESQMAAGPRMARADWTN